MTVLLSIVFPPLSYLVIVLLVFAGLIAFALYRKQNVRTVFWVRSFGFLLEANNDASPAQRRWGLEAKGARAKKEN